MHHVAALVLMALCCRGGLAAAQAPPSTRTLTVELPAAQSAGMGCMAIPVSDTPAVPERAVFNVTTALMQLPQWLPGANSTEVTAPPTQRLQFQFQCCR